MKIIRSLLLLPIAACLLLLPMGCAKDEPPYRAPRIIPAPVLPPLPPPPSQQLPLRVWAGNNLHIAYPADSVQLRAYASGDHGPLTTQWRKIIGPASYQIAQPDSLETKVTRLEVGEYLFGISANSTDRQTHSDTVSVFVIKPGATETIFKELAWECPMGCGLVVYNIYSFIPAGKPIKVWVRPAGEVVWTAVKDGNQWTVQDRFSYYLDEETIHVYADNEVGYADLKIEY